VEAAVLVFMAWTSQQSIVGCVALMQLHFVVDQAPAAVPLGV
jgi:hypothetical protein